jgi:signal transduction histidine kinase
VVYEGARVVDRAGAAPLRAARLRVAAEAIGGTSPAVKVVAATVGATSASKPVLVAAAHFQRSTGQQGLVVVTLSVADAYAARQGLVRVLLLSGAIALAAAILMGLGLGTWLCRPLSRLSVAARRMARGEYDQPVGGSYPGEVRELAVSLETMRLEVRRSEESLRTFVASAAHELRTPLTSIQGFSQALLDGTADTPEQRQRSEAAIYRESSRLRRLIDALLTLSRYDSREFSPTLTSVDVGAIVQEEAERLVQAGFAGPGRIKVVVAGETSLVTDAGLVRQIVGNLLRNAAQYGEGDPIEVSLRVENFELVLQVANGGPPLPADERGRIFERFFRGRVGRTTEGFGLGLSLVREMCEVLGGRIDLVGGGPKTVFRVALPLRPPAVLKTGE